MRFFSDFILGCALLLFLAGCTTGTGEEEKVVENSEEKEVYSNTSNLDRSKELPQLLKSVLEAHGGLSNWEAMQSMNFEIEREGGMENHLINLKNRHTLIQNGEKYKVGFDGSEVWVYPNKAAFGKGSARFYHNLRFYFIAMPFIVADPGINYEVLSGIELNGKAYEVLQVTYNDGVGDAPKDEYLLYIDPESYGMEWLLYTVTYYSDKPDEKYNALHYTDWEETPEGLLMPKTMVGYTYDNGKIGDKRYERSIEHLTFSTEPPHPNMFERPNRSEIDSLIQFQ